MKEGWTYKKLGEVCEIIGGGTPDKKNVDYYNGDIPWATVRDMNCDVLSTTDFSISEEGLHNSASHVIKKGNIIIATRVGLGKVCKIAQDTAINQDLKGIVPKQENINSNFLFYYFKDKAKFIETNGVGATVKGVKLKFIEDLLLPFPSLSEQQRIVSRLDAAFAHIDELKANAEKQLGEARTLFQKALAKAMEPKEGWEEKALKEIANIKGGKRVPKGYKLESNNTGYRYIRVADFTNDGTVDETNIQYISKEVFQQISNYTITSDDVYISIAGTIGKAGIIPPSLNGANLTENACKLMFIKPVEKRYVYLYTKTDNFKNQIAKATKQASQPKLALTRLAEITISLPPLPEQQRIVSRLDAISAHIRELEEVLQKTIAECDVLKQALLRKVFE